MLHGPELTGGMGTHNTIRVIILTKVDDF